MYIQSIKYETLNIREEKYEIIELKVRGEKDIEDFKNDISDMFSLAHHEEDESLAMLTLTFDKIPKEQTINMIRAYTKNWIEMRKTNN